MLYSLLRPDANARNPPRLRLMLPIFCICVEAIVTHGNANAWRHTSKEVCLLPFPMADGLLPGEDVQMHFAEPNQLNLFDVSMQCHHGCVAQLLERRAASSPDVKSYCAVAPLLEVREHRLCEDGGIWCSLTCVSAVNLDGVELRTVDEQQELHGANVATRHAADDDDEAASFLVASTRLLRERDAQSLSADGESLSDDDDEEEEAAIAVLAREVSHMHEEVNALRRLALELNPDGPVTSSDRVTSGGERIGPPPAADDRVTDGAYRLCPLIGPFITADELTKLRLDAASVRGVDEAPPLHADETNRLSDLWGTNGSERLHTRMLSFVAVEALHESYRMAAAAIDNTPARLRLALDGLKARKAALTAEVALRRAGGGST